ncbi:MAG: DUF1801 domain-containing protein [Flavobacteriales bacterium]|nr:DUF1801 domain-containing protein [Flavobacteriales bacterium]
MASIQNVRFKTLEEFFDYLPPDELKISRFLYELTQDCLPFSTNKLSFNVPYFYGHRAICFIWPGSVLWGKKRTYKGVRFGLTSGHLLNDETQYFKLESRKFVSYRDFENIHEIDIDLLKSLLFEAWDIDQSKKSK